MTNVLSRMRFIVLAISLLVAGLLLSSPLLGTAQTAKDQVCQGIGLSAANDGTCNNVPGDPNIDSLIPDIINILSIIVGVAAVIVLIIGGLKFITSAGDAAKTSAARNTILYALIGLVIVLVARSLVLFVVERVT